MYEDIKQVSKKILESSKELIKSDEEKSKSIESKASKAEISSYDSKIKDILKELKGDVSTIYESIKGTPMMSSDTKTHEKPSSKKIKEGLKISNSRKGALMKELNITEGDLKKFVKRQEKKKKEGPKQEFTVYKSNSYAKVSNLFMEKFTFSFLKKHPDLFKPLFAAMNSANLKIFTRSYVDMLLFSTLLAFPIATTISFLITTKIILALLIGIFAMPVVFLAIYAYPFSLVNTRRRGIHRELVFAIIHMAAISGSGAKPTKIFELLIKSGEYKELETEFKRILNHINLFGYSLSTSMRAVAETTPSPDFKELLHGLISTIEAGGNLKEYLSNKAGETLVRFRLDQKRYLESIATYSDIYTGLLIAAPLLFIITLAILEKIAPNLGGIPITTISSLGVFVLIPIMNIIFALFLEVTKSEI